MISTGRTGQTMRSYLRSATTKIRRSVQHRVVEWARRAEGGHHVVLLYPTSSSNTPRYGYGKPPHERLADILSRSKETYRTELASILEYRDDLLAIPARL